MKYKVGDKVRIVKVNTSWHPKWKALKGKTMKITKIWAIAGINEEGILYECDTEQYLPYCGRGSFGSFRLEKVSYQLEFDFMCS